MKNIFSTCKWYEVGIQNISIKSVYILFIKEMWHKWGKIFAVNFHWIQLVHSNLLQSLWRKMSFYSKPIINLLLQNHPMKWQGQLIFFSIFILPFLGLSKSSSRIGPFVRPFLLFEFAWERGHHFITWGKSLQKNIRVKFMNVLSWKYMYDTFYFSF